MRNSSDAKKRQVRESVVKIAMWEHESDFAYWQTQPYAARLAALEQIRQEYHRWQYGVQPRFQRVYRIVKFRNLKGNKKSVKRLQDLADVENLK
jgi:hypothetical protein